MRLLPKSPWPALAPSWQGLEMTNTEKEKLEVLNGDRGDKSKSAVRLKAVQALLNGVKTEPSGDTAADIREIYAAFNAMRAALQ
ncbi:hypothetical protein D3C78_1301480 [compost metagenome]